MRVLHINTVCKISSTGKIVYNLHSRFKEAGHESIVCYGRGELYEEEPDLIRIDTPLEVYIHAFLARVTGYQGYFSKNATNKLINIIEKFKPDTVILFNLHGYYLNEFMLLNYIKKKKIPVLYWLPDEYAYLGKCCYAYECRKFKYECSNCPQVTSYPKSIFFDRSKVIFNHKRKVYENFHNIVFASAKYIIERAKQSSLLKDKVLIEIDTGIDLENTFYPRDTKSIRKKLNIPVEKKIILMVGPYPDERKGGEYYIDVARRLLNEKDLVFIHVGVKEKVINLPENFIAVSYVSNQDELAEYYSLADLFVCTSLADAMPNVCLDALACGTPICGFDIAGTPYVASEEFGTFVSPRNSVALSEVIKNYPKKDENRIKECRKYAESRFSSKLFFEKCLALCTNNVKYEDIS